MWLDWPTDPPDGQAGCGYVGTQAGRRAGGRAVWPTDRPTMQQPIGEHAAKYLEYYDSGQKRENNFHLDN